MLVINSTTSPIFWAASARPLMLKLVFSASETASPAILVDWVTWRPTSSMDFDNSSAAAETVSTLTLACCAAAATVVDCALVSSAVADMDCAAASISLAEDETESMIVLTLDSKSSAIFNWAWRFSSSVRFSACACSSARRIFSMALSLKTWTRGGHLADLVGPVRSPGPPPRCRHRPSAA